MHAQIIPASIVLLDQIYLPVPAPFLNGLLTRYRNLDIVMLFVPNEARNAVLFGETPALASAMLLHSPEKIIGHAYIECALWLRCKDVGEVVVVAADSLSPRICSRPVAAMGPRLRGDDRLGWREA